MINSKTKVFKSPIAFAVFVVVCLYVITLIIPMIWTVLTSLKSREDFYYNKFSLPEIFMFSNYSVAFGKMYTPVETAIGTKNVYAWEMFINAFLYATGCAFMGVITPAVTGYCVAKYKFWFGKVIHSIVIITMLLPIVGSLPSELLVAKTVGTYDSMLGMYIMKGNFLGMNFLIFHATFKALSWDYSEAAFMDGASHTTVMFRIMMPMVMPTLSAMAILAFIGLWNDYSTPMVFMPGRPTIAYGLFRYQFSTDNTINSIPMQLAGCTLVMIPIFILFMLFKNKLVGNISIGGLKG